MDESDEGEDVEGGSNEGEEDRSSSINSESSLTIGGRSRKLVTIFFADIRLQIRPEATLLGTLMCRRGDAERPWKVILDGVSGTFEQGRVTAIMGPSGSGKTSLLNCLAGRITSNSNRKLNGAVGLNGYGFDISTATGTAALRNTAGYVMQDDILPPNITVEEQLRFIADMVLAQYSASLRAQAVDRVIADLGLMACRGTRIGMSGEGEGERGLSGGERKRTAIGEELLRDPQVLYLDEPTSGLDSETALVVCLLLREMARAGRTVVLTVHQPSSTIYQLFDNIVLLSKGKMIYSGPRENVPDFFEDQGIPIPLNVNPADYILHALIESEKSARPDLHPPEDVAGVLERNYASSRDLVELQEQNKKTAGHIIQPMVVQVPSIEISGQKRNASERKREGIGRSTNVRPNFFKRWWYLLKRSWISNARTKNATYMKLVQYIGISLFASFVFFQLGQGTDGIIGRSGALFAEAMLFSFMTSSGVVLLFPSQRAVFIRESVRKIYHPTEYFLAISFTEAPFQVAFSFISLVISYWIIGLRDGVEPFFQQALVLGLVALIGSGLGIAVGAGIEEVGQGMELTPSLIVPQMLVAGVFIARDQLPDFIRWFQQVSYLSWAYSASMQAEFSNRQLDTNSTIAPTGQGQEVLDFFSITSSYGMSIGILIANLVAYRLIGLAILWGLWKSRQL